MVDGVIAAGSAQLVSYSADQKGVVINVHLFHSFFHERLQKVIADYNDELRKPDSSAAGVAFRTKMDFICRVESQPLAAPTA